MTEQEIQFQKELLEKSEKAGRECGYHPERLIRTLEKRGAVRTAKELIRRGSVSDGFEVLQKAGRLELSLEASVVSRRFADLFTDEEVNHCFELLCECGYFGGA